jgi:hypothetical protein
MKLSFTKQTTCRLPTALGWSSIIAIIVAVKIIALASIYPFLSINKPVDAQTMVIEGWLPDYGLVNACGIFKNNKYSRVFTTGGPLEKGFYLTHYATYAQLSASTILDRGLDSAAVIAVNAPDVVKDRTFAAACALRDYLQQSGASVAAFNIVSLGPHARRTRLLYAKAFGASVKIGVIPIADRDYDSKMWWRSSDGFRTVTGEALAYLYARFLFRGK